MLLTPRIPTTMCSLMQKVVISSRVMMRSWTGLVFPKTAPKEMSTVAVLKSALIILHVTKKKKEMMKQEKIEIWNHTRCLSC